jgi:hypothetical protein
MPVKVCRNCLQPLASERRERGYTTCANCAKLLAIKQQDERPLEDPNEVNPLKVALKQALQKEAEAELERKELEKKQKNVEHFFDDFQKVKKGFW